MRRNLVVGAVAVAALLGLLGLLRFARPALPAARATGPAASEAPAPDALPLGRSAPAAAPRAEDAPAIEPVEPAAQARVEVAVRPVEPGGVAVRVMGPDGTPVARAAVSVLVGADDDARERFDDPDRIDALMQSEGRSRTADAAGLVVVPVRTEGPTLLVGRRGPLWGALALKPQQDPVEPVELALARDTTLRARVVSSSGAPVPGIEVRLLQEDRWSRWTVQSALAEGAEAIATLHHVQQPFREDPAGRWALGLHALFDGDTEHHLDPAHPPAEVVTLVLPPSGAVEVAVVGEDGAPYAGEALVRLGIIGEGEPPELSPFSHTRRREAERPLEGGVARFRYVEPGRDFEVSVERGRSDVATKVFGPGPTVPGATRTFDVRLGTDHPVGLVRVVDVAGRPVAEADLHVGVLVVDSYSDTSDTFRVRTDADGAFLVDLERDPGERTRREIVVTRRAPDAAELVGRLDASRPLADGVQELGVVRLEPPRLLVAGRVVTPAGEPVEGAELRLLRRVGTSGWRHERLEPRTDESGRFEVRGVRMADELRLRATTDGATSVARTFAPGTEDLLLELVEAGAIEGRLLLEASIPKDKLCARLTGADDILEYAQRNAAIGEDGGFRFDHLLPGSYGVAVLVFGLGKREPVEGIAVEAGRTTRDRRLDPLDLRDRLHAHHVTLTMPDDAHDLEGSTAFGAAGAEQLEHHLWFYEREFWIVAESERIDLVVSSPGYVSAHFHDVGGEIAATLVPTRPVRLVLPSDVRLPEPPVYLKAVLAGVDQDEKDVDWGASAFDEDREILVRVPGTGAMRVRWVLERRGASSSSASVIDLDPPQIVEVDGSPDQRIQLALTPEQIAKLLPGD